MEELLNFISKNYIIFTVISVILVLALIGYIVNEKTHKDIEIKHDKKKNPELIETPSIESQNQVSPTLENMPSQVQNLEPVNSQVQSEGIENQNIQN